MIVQFLKNYDIVNVNKNKRSLKDKTYIISKTED